MARLGPERLGSGMGAGWELEELFAPDWGHMGSEAAAPCCRRPSPIPLITSGRSQAHIRFSQRLQEVPVKCFSGTQ